MKYNWNTIEMKWESDLIWSKNLLIKRKDYKMKFQTKPKVELKIENKVYNYNYDYNYD